MKKLFKSILIVLILSLFALTFVGCNNNEENNNEQDNPVVNPGDDVTDAHKCAHVCEICGKCTDPNCTDPACQEKCPGHEAEPVEHKCSHVCEICGKCIDPNCTDPACAEKCEGHYDTPTEHVCEHVCPICGKCTDLKCTDPACSDKCAGHEIEPVEHKCDHVCPICGKCTDLECTDPACQEKCSGHEIEPTEHKCNHVCPICGKCTDLECTDPTCQEKCAGHEIEPVVDFTEEELAEIATVFSKKIPYYQNNGYSVDVAEGYVFITFYLSNDDYKAYLEVLNKTFNLVYDEEYEYYYYEDGTDCLFVYVYSDNTEEDNLIYLYIYQDEPFDLEILDQNEFTNADIELLKQYIHDYEKISFVKCYGYEVYEDTDEYGYYGCYYIYTNKEYANDFYIKLSALFNFEYDDLYECYFYETTTDCLELDIYEYNDDEYEVYLFIYQYDGSIIGGETPIENPDDFLDQTAFTTSDLAEIKKNFNGTIPFAKCYDYEVYADSDSLGDYTYIYFITDSTNATAYLNSLKALYQLVYDDYYDYYYYETETDCLEINIYEESGYKEVVLYLYQGSEETPIVVPDDFLNQTAYTESDLALISENFSGSIPFAKCYDYEVYTDTDDYGTYTYVYFLTDSANAKAFYNALAALYTLEYDDYYDYYYYETTTDCIELDIYEEDDYTEVILYLYQGEESGSGDTPAVTDGIEISVETLGSAISSSYATFEKTFDGITFKFSNLMINPKASGVSYDDFIQMKNSTKSGLISNTTPFSGLTALNAIFITNPSSGNLNTFKVYGGDTLGAKTYQATIVSEIAVTVEGIDGTQIFYEFSTPVKYITIENTGATTFYNLVFGASNGGQGGSDVTLVDDGNGYTTVDFTKGKVKNVTELGDYLDGCPTTGNLNVLIIPVEFSDCTAESKGYTVDMIEKVFNGSEDDTFLYYSVKKYFDLASYGNLKINFDVVDQFITAKYASTEYEKEYKQGTSNIPEYFDYYGYSSEDSEGSYATPEMLILDECLQYLDKELNYDLSKYDSDNNETIDAVILIYTADIDDVSDDAFYWAFRAWNLLGNPEELYDPEVPEYGYDWYRYDGVYANDYLWASYQFIFEAADGETFDSYNTVNTYTFIHEFSHVLGADDYYDYSYKTEPMDGYDMMDMSSADHNLFTKAYFGWITNARLITTEESVTLTLNSMENSGDAIILANSFDESKGLFQEYYLIQYYTNTGLNTKNGEMFDENGIVIYHISANATYDSEYEAYYLDNNNTSYSRDTDWGTTYNLITLISSNGNYVFGVNDTIPALKLDNGATIGFTFTVDALTDDAATISFQRK